MTSKKKDVLQLDCWNCTEPVQMNSMKDAVNMGIAILELGKKLYPQEDKCIVLDIDGTVLTTDPRMDDKVFPDPEMFRLYKYAIDNGYSVYFVTARIDQLPVSPKQVFDNRTSTQAELLACGYNHYRGIYFRNDSFSKDENYSLYKWLSRKEITEKRGQKIMLNIGDHWEDIVMTPPFCKDKATEKQVKTVMDLDHKSIYFGQFPDFSLFSIKVPHEEYTRRILHRQAGSTQSSGFITIPN